MPFPWSLRPMLATPGPMPARTADWAFEFKWDGYRALAGWDGRRFALLSRNGHDLAPRFPELAALPAALGGPTLLDGELVVFDARGRPSFQLLQNRFPDLPGALPDDGSGTLRYVVFDLLHHAGTPLVALPYRERRQRLLALRLEDRHWTAPAHREGGGAAMLAAARTHALEGIIAKRLGSRYQPGRRSPDWVKVKITRREEFVIGGFTIGKEPDGFAGLLLGTYDHPGAARLRYAGLVGTGFTTAQRRSLRQALEGLRIAQSPFAGRVARPDPRYVRPVLVAEIAFSEITRDGLVRHPSFQGLRPDKAPTEVVRER